MTKEENPGHTIGKHSGGHRIVATEQWAGFHLREPTAEQALNGDKVEHGDEASTCRQGSARSVYGGPEGSGRRTYDKVNYVLGIR